MAAIRPRVGDGRYELRTRLDNGHFGVVWDAWDLDEDVRVAVKLLGPRVAPDRVLQEARLHRRLSEHRRILRMRNVIVSAAPVPIVVMDFVEDGSIQKFIERRRPTVLDVPPTDVVNG